ncbi:MAG: amidohydrolase family protein [Alphaproteobacteria bacterium]|nr:amidohydrolase family protein [Alphaproteobacteria bacterium]
MTPIDLLLTDARLPDGRLTTIAVAGGRIVALDAPAEAVARERIHLGGDLVLPALIDGHMHLDKTLVGLPWIGHAAEPFRMSRIETDKRILPGLPLSTEQRAANLARLCVAQGTGHIRTHVDIDNEGRLAKLEGVCAARERLAGAVSMQIVAFPQSGVMRCPGVLDLLDAAMREGADLVGGIDPLEIDRDPKGQLDGIFAIADRHGRGLDIHLHEPGEMGLFNVQEICSRTRALGLQGKVTISHGFCLGGVAESKQQAAAELMGECGVALVTHGAASAPLPPIALLRRHGVTVFAGNDDVRDTWSPYGNADMLERISYIGWRADLRHDPMLHDILELATGAGAKALGLERYGLAVGNAADLVTLRAEGVPEAVGAHAPRRLVLHAGRVVARDGAYCGP